MTELFNDSGNDPFAADVELSADVVEMERRCFYSSTSRLWKCSLAACDAPQPTNEYLNVEMGSSEPRLITLLEVIENVHLKHTSRTVHQRGFQNQMTFSLNHWLQIHIRVCPVPPSQKPAFQFQSYPFAWSRASLHKSYPISWQWNKWVS